MIRNFLYLDSDKLRSISSQLFEGVADSILKREVEESANSGSQKGPFGSGEVLADIFRKNSEIAHTTVLEDHAYTLFEEKIIDTEKTIEINSSTAGKTVFDKPFIRVTGYLSINDMKVISNVLVGFNELGADITRVVHQAELKARALGKAVNKKDVEKLAASNDMQMDKDFTDSLNRLIEFSSKGSLEFEISQGGYSFVTPMKRNCLRENEQLLVQNTQDILRLSLRYSEF